MNDFVAYITEDISLDGPVNTQNSTVNEKLPSGRPTDTLDGDLGDSRLFSD